MHMSSKQENSEGNTSMNIADRLNLKIVKLKSPIVVGLDPVLSSIPDVYKEPYRNLPNPFEGAARVILDFNRDMIDVVHKIAPAVKQQVAFYEKYGHWGLWAFQESAIYARSSGMIVIEDGKRNDIGSTADAYAEGHLGKVELLNGELQPSLDVDWLTVSPFLGKDGLEPFVETCINNNKGIFILVKTSNPSSDDIQNRVVENGNTVYANLAIYVNEQAQRIVGQFGYSPIGAVVGATCPHEAYELRKIMPNNIFLVPGYGMQGGDAGSVVPCFNNDALGAIVNNSRGIMNAWKAKYSPSQCTKTDFRGCVAEATETMRNSIVLTLKEKGKNFPKLPDC